MFPLFLDQLKSIGGRNCNVPMNFKPYGNILRGHPMHINELAEQRFINAEFLD
jgi:hypothetical protein